MFCIWKCKILQSQGSYQNIYQDYHWTQDPTSGTPPYRLFAQTAIATTEAAIQVLCLLCLCLLYALLIPEHGNNLQHPSTEQISTAKGSHRMEHLYVTMTVNEKFKNIVEITHDVE